MAELLLGAPVADALTEEVAARAAKLTEAGHQPTLAIIRVGERDDDLSYERGATKRCDKAGIAIRKFLLPADCSQEDLMAAVNEVNTDDAIDGCLMFRPLPKTLDEIAACAALDPAKDMDGITQGSLYGVFANQAIGYPPCTADACMQIIKHYGYELKGANVTVVGRSLVIGKPVSMMLQAATATVTMCHTKTVDVDEKTKAADILVVAAGHIGTVGASGVREGQVVIDVGINWNEELGKLAGDVAFDEVEPIVAAITPVPRGVGSVTTAILAEHVVTAAERKMA